MEKVFEIIYHNIENYSDEEIKKLGWMFTNSIHKFNLIEYFIEKVSSSINILVICQVFKLCVMIDLSYTRDWLEEQKLEPFYDYLLIYSIVKTYQANITQEDFMICLEKFKNQIPPERSDSLLI